ncbi:MAG: DNA repair protein RadA, partial [Spirochaetia bacterium]|nr:DNA repair protein RadA [Spirochaetia bacterium]
LLEIARRFKGTFYYFSGEESPAQVRLRADRMGLDADTVCFSADANLENILDRIKADKPDLVVVDSIQTIYRNRQSLPGSTSQLREAAVAFMEICKETCIPLIATGHITKDGVVAGPRLLEHMVDTVLYFESDRLNHLRLVRAVKNRFGPVGEVALFEMHAHGLSEHSSGQGLSVSMRGSGPGRVFSALTEGSRAIAVEVQALVCRAAYGPARRTAEGLDTRRLTILAAVMEKHVKVSLSDYDIFANLAGGLTSDEPALDLAIAAAVISSARDITVPADMAFLGEIGLSGEIRAVPRMNERIKELMNLGFRRICLPDAARPDPEFSGMDFRSVESVAELASAVSGITMHAVLPKAG